MPDDETLVRERLLRLFGGRPDPVVRPEPADLSDPVARLDSTALSDPVARFDSTALSDPDVRPDPAIPPGPAVRPAVCPPEDEPSALIDRAPPPRLLGVAGVFDPGRRGIRALAVVATVVVLGAAGWAWRSRPQAQPVGAQPATTNQVVAGATTVVSGPEVVVAVAGRVRRPGLVHLPAGARVADAIAAAGGVQPGTDIALLNLARKVSDGELILVGVTAPPGAGAQPGGQPGADGAGSGGKVNLNTATLAQLDTLPGVGPVLAQRIIDHRERHGGFRSVSDLRRVEGIGDARYEDLKGLVTV